MKALILVLLLVGCFPKEDIPAPENECTKDYIKCHTIDVQIKYKDLTKSEFMRCWACHESMTTTHEYKDK